MMLTRRKVHRKNNKNQTNENNIKIVIIHMDSFCARPLKKNKKKKKKKKKNKYTGLWRCSVVKRRLLLQRTHLHSDARTLLREITAA
jgi:hypothetical protein